MFSRPFKALAIIGVVAIVALAAYLVAVLFASEPGEGPGAEGDAGAHRPDASTPAAEPSKSPDDPTAHDAASTNAPDRQRAKARRLPDREAREALVRAIAEARGRREASRAAEVDPSGYPAAGSGGEGADGEPRGQMSREYIQETVHEAEPLIRECYDLALDEDREVGGRLVVRFVIAGEPEAGGLIESVELEEIGEGLASSETLLECMRETIYTLEFDPPEGGGRVIVSYPFNFSTGDEE